MCHREFDLQTADIQPTSQKACIQETSNRQYDRTVSHVKPQEPYNLETQRPISPILISTPKMEYIIDIILAKGFIISSSVFHAPPPGSPIANHTLTYGV